MWEREDLGQTYTVIGMATTEKGPLQSTAGASALQYKQNRVSFSLKNMTRMGKTDNIIHIS